MGEEPCCLQQVYVAGVSWGSLLLQAGRYEAICGLARSKPAHMSWLVRRYEPNRRKP